MNPSRLLLLAAALALAAPARLGAAGDSTDSSSASPRPPGGGGGAVSADAAITQALTAEVGDDPTRQVQVLGLLRPTLERMPAADAPDREARLGEALATITDPVAGAVLRRAYGLMAPNPSVGGSEHHGPPGAPGGGAAGDSSSSGGDRMAGPPHHDGHGHGGHGGEEDIPPAWRLRGEFARRAAELSPNDPGTRTDLGTYYYFSGNNQSAFSNLGRAIELGDRSAQTIATYGRAAYGLGDYGLAERSGQRALQVDPDNRDADALVKLARGRVSSVSLPSALSAMGALGGDTGALGASGAAAAAAKPGSAAGGAVFAGGGGQNAAEIAAAAARMSQAPVGNVQQSAALTREAAQALGVRDYDAAHAISSKAIDLNPQNAQAWNYRAIADNKLGRFPDAVYDASFSLTLAPGNAPALQSRSWAFSKQGKYKEALADANYTLEKEPDNAFAYQNRAFALAGMGEREDSLDSLKRSADLDERFKPKYEAALQAPQSSDLLFLFDEDPGSKAGVPVPVGDRKRRFLRLILLSMTGGVLVALGLLHTISATFRDRMGQTMRRVMGGGAHAPAAEAAGAGADGAVWAQYELVRTIGSGGMGVVYEARDTALDRPVAVKKMRDEIRADPLERRRFVQEARTVAALHHPNIVDIYAIIEDAGDVYLVFEFVPGRTLAEMLGERQVLGFDEARKVLKGACEAVEHAHRHGVIHRDIKPSNIMLTQEGMVKVMDFGVARQAKEAATKMAMTNTIVGTPPYMAPEQEQGTVRKESDVFSLAVCFYEMLSGELPFHGQGAGMLLNKINGRHAPLSQKPLRDLPPGLDAVLNKALAPDPAQRYSTPAEFLAAVEHLSAARAS